MQIQRKPSDVTCFVTCWNKKQKRVLVEINENPFSRVPEVGLEPTRVCPHWILNLGELYWLYFAIALASPTCLQKQSKNDRLVNFPNMLYVGFELAMLFPKCSHFAGELSRLLGALQVTIDSIDHLFSSPVGSLLELCIP